MNDFSFGIEEEYFVVDAETKLVQRRMPTEFMLALKRAIGPAVTREFLQAQLEVMTQPSASLADAGRELRGLRQAIGGVAAEHGLAFFAAGTHPTAAWWGRALHYVRTMQHEPVGVVLAMQSTQEGQQVALNKEVTLPAFAKHYGYPRGSRAIAFFEEHAEADDEHSTRQINLAIKYLDTPALQARACKVAEEACKLRWASISDIYRSEVLKEKPILPRGL